MLAFGGRSKCDAGCGNFSKGFAGYAFAMVELGNGGQEMVIESSGAVWDDLYSDEFGAQQNPRARGTARRSL